MSTNRSNAFRNLVRLTSVAFCLNTGAFQAENNLSFLAPAIKFERAHDLKSALSEYEKAVRSQPDCWQAYCGRGAVYAQLGEQKLAMADFNKAISLHPDKASPYVKRSMLLDEWGQKPAALKDAQTAQKMAATDAEVLLQVGAAKEQLADYKGAEEAYRQDIKSNPKYAKGYVALAKLLALKSVTGKESITLLTQAIAIDPANVQAFFARGILYHRKGNEKAAVADLDKASELARKGDDRYLATQIGEAAQALKPTKLKTKQKQE